MLNKKSILRSLAGLSASLALAIATQLPESFAAPKGTEGIHPLSATESLRAIRTQPGLEVELVAAEPLVRSPVAIDWGADGKLWVAEMIDYPAGSDGNYQPGGRITFLKDTNEDGHYDTSTVFLDGLPFPTGVMAWGRGILVCAAPDILYAEDTNGDGTADKIEKLFSGFSTDNYQARVNSLSLGLDNWIYGANGLISQVASNETMTVDIRNRDFRFRPLHGPVESVTGLTQQGRARDDWGRWFGCDNSRALLYYPHEERYLRRNPHGSAPKPILEPTASFDANRIYPISHALERFNDPGAANRMTAACGLGLYRDTLLGESFYGNTFTCESVHNVVHRLILNEDGFRLNRRRADEEQQSEFLASTDNWFRPVQARTGPDGALYVVDMYRFVIEHPRWIPAARLTELDVRAGADKGRIYRVRPEGKPLRAVHDLTKLDAVALARALDSSNGTERDRVHVELLFRKDSLAVVPLERLAATASLPQVRLQSLCVLDGLDSLQPGLLKRKLHDGDHRVRQQAVRLSEKFMKSDDSTGKSTELQQLMANLLTLTNDPSLFVIRQLAFTLGESPDSRAGHALAYLAKKWVNDPEIRVAILSSSARHGGDIFAAVMSLEENTPGRTEWISPLVSIAAASPDQRLFARAVAAALPEENIAPSRSQLTALASLIEGLERRRKSLSDYFSTLSETSDTEKRLEQVLAFARGLILDTSHPDELREAALHLIGRTTGSPEEIELLCTFIMSNPPEKLRATAFAALRRQRGVVLADRLLHGWPQISPAVRADIISLLITRDEWVRSLLKAVKQGTVQPHEISLIDRQHLWQHTVADIRQAAFETLPQSASNVAGALQHYQDALSLPGVAARGVEVFSKNCAACHSLEGIGHQVGPDLAPLRNKNGDYWLKNILDPNAVVEPRFVTYQIEINDDRVLSGIIKLETANSLTLVSGNGVTETVGRADIVNIRASSLSLMPEGLEQGITLQEMADLIAFLKSNTPPRQFAGNKPEMIQPTANGWLMLSASKAEIYGTETIFEPEFKNIGMWHHQDDYAAWTIQIEHPAMFDVHLDYACAEGSAGNRFSMEISSQSITGVVAATGSDWTGYRQMKVGSVQLDAGRHRVIVRPDGPLARALFDLRTVAFTPPRIRPRWPTSRPSADNLPRDSASVANFVLNSGQPDVVRETAINANPQFAADLILELTRDLTPGTPDEYARIPWLWRVAIACGRRNDPSQMLRILSVSLPEAGEPLHDWQAVVIGGGIIGGLGERNLWPGVRLDEILSGDESLRRRWERAIDLSSSLADDENVPAGTRYDALRMLGLDSWEKRGSQLVKYLAKGTNEELQMGAVSGIADMNSPQATVALLEAWPHLSKNNRHLVLAAMFREESRTAALLDAIEFQKVDSAELGRMQRDKLLNHENARLRQRATEILLVK